MKKYLAIILGILLSGCNQLAVLSIAGSTASLVVNNNPLIKTYSGIDVLTFMSTDKDIKTHVYNTVTTVKKKVNKTFILEKPPMLESEKRVLVALPIIKVEVSEIFRPDHNLLLVSALTYPIEDKIPVEDKIETTTKWNLSFVLLLGLIFIIHLIENCKKIRRRRRRRRK